MKCPYCAEEIRDEAILCRFCGATKTHAGWQPPRPPQPPLPPPVPVLPGAPATRKSNFTFRTAAVFFIISAAFEVLSLASPVPLFGVVRGGAVAALYHALYCALFVAMGVGLWQTTAWGYNVMLGGTVFFTLDKALYLMDSHARTAEITRQLREYGVMDMVDPGSITLLLKMMNLVTLLILACWWGFMLYLYWHRNDFAPRSGACRADGDNSRDITPPLR